MNHKRVLVTGACGYIGRHVVQELLKQGCQVIASDIRNDGLPGEVTYTDYPIFDGSQDIFEKLGSPDVLIHLAWRQGFIHNAPAHMADLSSHITFLNHMIDSKIWSVSVMGSMHEVGYWEGPIRADTPCNPLSQYGVAKNALRQSMLLYTKDKSVNFHWLRAFYIYGDDKRGSSIFAKLQQAAAEGKETFPFTTGKNLYDFITVEKLAEQIVAATLQDRVNGIINVCSGEPRSLSQQVDWYIEQNHLPIRLAYGAFPDRPYDSPGIWGDNTEIQKIMNMVPAGIR